MIIMMTPRPHLDLQNYHGYAKEFIRKFMDYLGTRLQRVSPALLDHLKRDSSPRCYSYVLPVTSSLHNSIK